MNDREKVSLALVWGKEWSDLDIVRQDAIACDYHEAFESESLPVSEYKKRIGIGNLRAYGDVMLVSRKRS